MSWGAAIVARARGRLDRRGGLRRGGGGDHLRRRHLHDRGLGAQPVSRPAGGRRGAASAGGRARGASRRGRGAGGARRGPGRGAGGAAVAPPAHSPAPDAGAISERVRDAARAAGEAARAALGDVAPVAPASSPAGRPAALAAPREGRAGQSEAAQGGRAEVRGAPERARDLPLRPDRGLGAGGDRVDRRESRGLQRAGDARRLGRAGEDPRGRRRDGAFAARRPRRVDVRE